MTRTQKSHDQIDSVGKNFIKKYPEFDLKKRKAGPVAINARRLIYEDGNHNLRTATPHYPFVHGALQGPNAWAVHQEGYIVRQGPTKLYAQSSLEIGPIKVAEDGRIVNFIQNIDTGRVMVAVTNGNDGEITQPDANEETLTVESDSALDITQYVKVYGLAKTTLAILVETSPILTGATAVVVSTSNYKEILGMEIVDADGVATVAVGSVILKNTTLTTLVTITAANSTAGIDPVTNPWNCYDRKAGLTIDLLEAVDFIIEGYDLEGIIQREKIVWTAADEAVYKETVNRYSRITRLINGDHAAAQTLKIDGIATNDIVTDYVNNDDNLTTGDAADQGGDAAIILKSSSASDITQYVTIAWKNAAGTLTIAAYLLTGTSDVAVGTGDTVVGAWLDVATVGSVIIDYNTGTVVLEWDGSATLGGGMLTKEDGDVAYAGLDLSGNNGLVTITCSNGSAVDILAIQGEDIDGSAQSEILTLSSGTIETANKYSRITHIYCSGTEDTEYFTISNEVADDGNLKLGVAFEPSDAQDTVVECELY